MTLKPTPFYGIDRSVAPDAERVRWDAPQRPYDEHDEAAVVEYMRRPPPFRPALMPTSFYFAWGRRWAAHRLSTALGYPSKEPVIR